MMTTVVETIARPDAPYDLTDEQAEEWRAVVNRMPADWFPRETWGVLTEYCRMVVEARRMAQLIEATVNAPNFDLAQYKTLTAMRREEARAICSLATKMRLTQQATIDKKRQKPTLTISKPWES